MSEEAMIRNCAPTLAGIKTGNLFRYPYRCREEMAQAVRYWNRQLQQKGVRVLPLKYSDMHALIYVYRPSHLSVDLQSEEAGRILRRCGYCPGSPEQCVAQLIRRMRIGTDFPHEIGLFLGYPPEDVSGFIEQRACGYKCAGCWKVYGDEEKCRRLFAAYKQCTRIYQAQHRRGVGLAYMTVAERA